VYVVSNNITDDSPAVSACPFVAFTGALAADVNLGAGMPRSAAGEGFSAASSPAPAATETIGANMAAAIIMEHLAPYSESFMKETSCTAGEGGALSGVCIQRSAGSAAAAADVPAGRNGVQTLSEVAGPKSVPRKEIVRTEGRPCK
jgi:hypothetical protein